MGGVEGGKLLDDKADDGLASVGLNRLCDHDGRTPAATEILASICEITDTRHPVRRTLTGRRTLMYFYVLLFSNIPSYTNIISMSFR